MDKNMMMEELIACAKNGGSEAIIEWFASLNKKYKKMKKRDRVDDDVMMNITEFFIDLKQVLGDEYLDFLYSSWGDNVPALVKDMEDFSGQYSRLSLARVEEKMDDFEKEESHLLAEEIWAKGVRTELTAVYFDWDNDMNNQMGLSIPRERFEESYFELQKICSTVIYNRGELYITFYSKRGLFEVAGIYVIDGMGGWENMTEDELSNNLVNGLGRNEVRIQLRHKPNSNATDKGERESKNGDVIYLDFNTFS